MNSFIKRLFSAKDIWFLLAIMAITLVVRVGLHQRFSNSESMKSTMAWVDSWDYVNYSKAIFNGIFLHTEFNQAESDFYRIDEVPPVYPIFLAVYYKLVGYDHLKSIIIVNLLLNLLIIYQIYWLTRKLTGNKLALLPALLWGVYFNSLVHTGQAIKEPFITIFILLIISLLYRLWNSFTTGDIVLLAVANAVFSHMDERYLFMAALSGAALIYILAKQGKQNRILRSVLLYTLISVALFTPWQIRNYLRYNRFVLITPRTTLITDPIFGYQNSEKVIADLTEKVSPAQIDSIYQGVFPASIDTVTVKNIIQANQNGLKPHYFTMGERIFYNTIGFWQMASVKPFLVGSGYKFAPKWSMKQSLMIIPGYTLFFLLSLPAFYLGIRRKNFLLLLFLVILLLNTLQHAVLGAGLVRYRAVMDPLIFIAAAYTISEICEIRRRRKAYKAG